MVRWNWYIDEFGVYVSELLDFTHLTMQIILLRSCPFCLYLNCCLFCSLVHSHAESKADICDRHSVLSSCPEVNE